MICTIRIPNVLQGRIDMAAGEGKRSEWMLEACRMRLDGSASIPPTSANQAITSILKREDGTPSEFGKMIMEDGPDMQYLRDICAGSIPRHHDSVNATRDVFIAPAEIPICGKTWWEEGEHFECLMDAGHREQKHGMRGMVRRLDA